MPTKQKIPVESIRAFVKREDAAPEGRDRGVCTGFLPRGEGDFILGLFPMEGKIEPPLTLVQTNSADVPGHSNKKLFSGRGCYPPPPTSVQIDSTEVSGCSGQKKIC